MVGFLPDSNNSTRNDQIEDNDEEFAVLYAIDNFRYQSHKIFFYIYVLFHNMNSVPTIIINVQIIYYLRLLSEKGNVPINCKSDGTYHGELYRYTCEETLDEEITSISNMKGISIKPEDEKYKYIIIDNTTSSLAELNDITNQTMNRINLDKGFVYIKNCEFISKNPVIQIKGETEDVTQKANLVLDVKNYDGFVKVDSNILVNNNKRFLRNLEGERDVIVQLNPSEPLSTNLNKTAGVLDDGRNALIHFKKNADSSVNYSPDYNSFFNNKNKTGLTGGAITAIVISLAAVIIFVIIIAYITMKKPLTPPKHISANSDAKIEMSSSTNVIN